MTSRAIATATVVFALGANAYGQAGIFQPLIRTPDVSVVAVLPKDSAAYVAVINNLESAVGNLHLSCRFKLADGSIAAKSVTILDLPAGTRIEIRSEVGAADQLASCAPVEGTKTSPPVVVSYSPVPVQ